jgi:hypothetical protein
MVTCRLQKCIHAEIIDILHTPEKSSHMMKKFQGLLFTILLGSEKASNLALENLSLR